MCSPYLSKYVHIRTRNMCKIFSRSFKKTCRQRKLRQTKRLFFNFWMIKLTKAPILPNGQVLNGFFGITVTFIVTKENILHILQALESNHNTNQCSTNFLFIAREDSEVPYSTNKKLLKNLNKGYSDWALEIKHLMLL